MLIIITKLHIFFEMTIDYAEKHIEIAPALTKVVFFAEQSDFVDKSGRWDGLGISRGGRRLRRRIGRWPGCKGSCCASGKPMSLWRRRRRGAGCGGLLRVL